MQHQLWPACVHRACINLAAIRREASAAEHHAHRVRAALELLGDIVRDIERALVVLRHGRRENGVANFRAIDVKL